MKNFTQVQRCLNMSGVNSPSSAFYIGTWWYIGQVPNSRITLILLCYIDLLAYIENIVLFSMRNVKKMLCTGNKRAKKHSKKREKVLFFYNLKEFSSLTVFGKIKGL